VIDINSETLISLAEAARLVPPARRGKKTHLSTLLRWILRGSRGPDGEPVRLEGVRLGNRWMTSASALTRFMTQLTPVLPEESRVTQRPEMARSRTSARADAELDRMGV